MEKIRDFADANEKFIYEDNDSEMNKKLFITKVCSVAIANALRLLGIVPVEKI